MSKEPQICLRESVASAVNARDMTPGRRAVDVLGALGAAVHNRYFDTATGTTRSRISSAGAAQINPRKRLAALLERAKFGMDRACIQPAIVLFADYLRQRGEYAHWRLDAGGLLLHNGAGNALILRFSGGVVCEWLHDRCAQCGGSGQIAFGPVGERNTRTKTCGLCDGAGAARVSHPVRAQILGVDRAIYDKHWRERFAVAHLWLAAIDESVIKPLRAQLNSGKLRPTCAIAAGASLGQPQLREPLPPGVD